MSDKKLKNFAELLGVSVDEYKEENLKNVLLEKMTGRKTINIYLKPCPFCGESKISIEKISESTGWNEGQNVYFISCDSCKCSTERYSDRDQDEYKCKVLAISKWNIRIHSPT